MRLNSYTTYVPALAIVVSIYGPPKLKPQFPPSASVYDYYVDPKKLDWELWEPKVPPFRYLKTMPFHKMIVPTVDTVRPSDTRVSIFTPPDCCVTVSMRIQPPLV